MGKRLPEIAANDIVTLGQDKSEVGALALITLDPAKYVAEVFKPYRTKLDALKAEAALIHFEDDKMRDEPHKFVDISTVAGMDIAIKYRAAFRDDVRIAAEKTRVVRKAPMLSIGKLLDSEYKALELDAGPFEARFDDAIREETKRKEAIKAAKELAEAERIAAIRAKIAEISSLPAKHARATAAQLTDALRELATREIMKEEFAEQTDDARAAVDTAAAELIALRDAAKASEAAALAAEEARKAEAARIEQERQELAKLRADAERVANEQAAERQRLANLAAAQEAEARRVSEKAAANLKAEQEALAEQVRLQREAATEAQRKLDAQQAEIEAQRAAFAREQEEAAARVEDELAAAVQREIDRQAADILRQQIPSGHAEGLEMNAVLDAAIARIEPVEKFTSDDLTRCNATVASLLADNLPPPESCCARDARIDSGDDLEVTDKEIFEMGAGCSVEPDDWVERLEAFCKKMTAVSPTGQRYSRTTFKDTGESIFLNADGSRSIFCDVAD